MVLPGKLAVSGDALVLVLGAERLPGGRGFNVHVEPLEGVLSGEPLADATAINAAIERMVLRFPTQYLWGYNRYKKPANAPDAPDAPDAPETPDAPDVRQAPGAPPTRVTPT
jgi:KDO2-lipid IV(A) lauroyltransferase